MEKIKRAMRLSILIFLMVLASIGLSITGAAPTLPKEKETVMEEESKSRKGKKKLIPIEEQRKS